MHSGDRNAISENKPIINSTRINREYREMNQSFRQVFSSHYQDIWRKPFGFLVYAQQSLFSLPPLLVLFWLPNNAWYFILLKALSGIWLILVLVTHLFGTLPGDRVYGYFYRKNRTMYIFIMLCTALALWNPSRTVFYGALAGFVFFSVGYIVFMQTAFIHRMYMQKPWGEWPQGISIMWKTRADVRGLWTTIYPEAPVYWILLRCLIAGIAIGFFGTIVFVLTVFQLVKFKERKTGRSDLMVTSAWNVVFILLGLGIGWEFLFPKPVLYLGPFASWWAILIGVPAGIAVGTWGASKVIYRLGDLGLTLCLMAIEGWIKIRLRRNRWVLGRISG